MYQFGDIVLLPFPYTDLSAAKTRPAVIVSSAFYQTSYPDLVVCYVSSRISEAGKPLDHVIQKWQEAGLLKPSFLRPKFATIDPGLIVLPIGALADTDKASLERMLCKALGLTGP
jgi:mRNA interferase MazF